MILGVAGHRPQKINTTHLKLRTFAQTVMAELRPAKVITGMAVGWDQACAEAAHDLGIPFIAAVPFEGQESRWPGPAQATYWWLLGQAAEVVHVSTPGYSVEKMYKRNRWVIGKSDKLAALYDGLNDSGTAHAVQFAERAGVPVIQLWDRWLAY